MTDEVRRGDGNDTVSNKITGGLFVGAVIQGRDITVQLPEQIAPALSGLPPRPRSFAGRKDQLAELLEALAPDQSCRAARAAISGLPGVGKTQLALQAAYRALDEPDWFPGGALFVDLQGYDDERRLSPNQALGSFLRALAIPREHVPDELEDRARLYRTVLSTYAEHGRRILVIIDNACSAAQVRPLLPSNASTAVLITSRGTLDIDARLYDLAVLTSSESVDLIRQVLRRARGNDDTRVVDAPTDAIEIAQLCGQLPLALDICAALLADMPSRPLASVKRSLLEAHTRLRYLCREDRAVQASFDLSYEQLTASQARLFRLLPLNPGPDISSQAAAHLADIDEGLADEVLTDLARAHLVDPGDVWGRWRMHDLIRLYADGCGRRHAHKDLRDQANLRLIHHYDRTTKAAVDRIEARSESPSLFADHDEALAWLETERANLVGIVTVAADDGHDDTAVSLAADLSWFFHRSRYLDEWVEVGTTAVAASRRIGDRDGEGRMLSNLGAALKEARRFEESIGLLEAAASCFREVGDVNSEGAVLGNLGAVMVDARQYDEAVDVLKSSMTKLSGASPQSEVVMLTNLGLALRSTQRYEEAVSVLAAAGSHARRIGDRRREGVSLLGLGETWAKLGRFEDAVNALTGAMEIFQETGERRREGSALSILGETLGQVNRTDEALEVLATAVAILRDVDDRQLEGRALAILGSILRQAYRFEESIDTQREAASIFHEIGDYYREGVALAEAGEVLQDLRKFEEALDAHKAAAAIFHTSGDIHNEALAQASIGASLVELKYFDEAIAVLTPVAATLREVGDAACEGVALANRGFALRSIRRFDEAVVNLASAAAIFREIGDQHREYMAAINLSAALQGQISQ
ncbi:ATP-binding protein [Streptomyces lutosisoli]|uniref:ATP-binding protein n=1 Tax=Streptomyces lutosisoli TaxID=2665721 RepID=A0ABW2VRW1_9ACTN